MSRIQEASRIETMITCIFNLRYYHIKLTLILILCNYDTCYHGYMNFLHWHAILLNFTFFVLFSIGMYFIDV